MPWRMRHQQCWKFTSIFLRRYESPQNVELYPPENRPWVAPLVPITPLGMSSPGYVLNTIRSCIQQQKCVILLSLVILLLNENGNPVCSCLSSSQKTGNANSVLSSRRLMSRVFPAQRMDDDFKG